MLRRLFDAFFIVLVALSQNVRASSICATVSDPAGQPIRKAAVQIIHLLDPDARFSVVVDSKGRACAEHLPEGLYSVEAGSFGSGFLKVRYYPVRVVFPDDVDLSFRLPFGDIGEGGVQSEAILSGTLTDQGNPASDVKFCLFHGDKPVAAACTVTNGLGQYSLIVPPGIYRLELTPLAKRTQSRTIDLSSPGYYRNRVTVDPSQ
ncbi:MAG: carboxypeptidase regulatory-like domain-containing protein [Acidobacteria bacterium]|nr:carboxypeptidase regulatory-like domain-containing protein [Acidobacteriota bacterium]